MTPQISFFVPGIPKGQPRPRAFFNKHTGRASVFDAGTAEAWKASIAVEAVMDAMTQLGWFWGDDAQVSTLVVVKRYAYTDYSGALIEVGEVAP